MFCSQHIGTSDIVLPLSHEYCGAGAPGAPGAPVFCICNWGDMRVHDVPMSIQTDGFVGSGSGCHLKQKFEFVGESTGVADSPVTI